MSAALPEEMELIEKHEEILGQRAELLEQMEGRGQQLKIQRRQQLEESETAHCRNNTLLQDLQRIEDRLRGKELPRPYLLALETKYWATVEESIPAWENFLLGKAPHPTDGPELTSRRTTNKPSTTTGQGRPPRPKPRPAR